MLLEMKKILCKVILFFKSDNQMYKDALEYQQLKCWFMTKKSEDRCNKIYWQVSPKSRDKFGIEIDCFASALIGLVEQLENKQIKDGKD